MMATILLGDDRKRAAQTIIENHYAHSVSSGKSHFFSFDSAIVVYSIPPNKNIARYLFGREAVVWELSRLYAPDGHEKNLLTMAIAQSVRKLRTIEPSIEAIVSYADPNVGHLGGVYRAASWLYTGQVQESRYYMDATGQVVSRRRFHSGGKSMIKAEILALGYQEVKRPGRHRYVKPLTKKAKRIIYAKWKTTEVVLTFEDAVLEAA